MHLGAQLALLLTAAIWGWTFVLVKESVQEVTPFLFLFARFTLATVVLVLIFRKSLIENWNWKMLRRGSLLGAALAAGYLFQTWGLKYTTATKSGFITGISVVLVPLMGVFFKERIGLGAWIGTLLSFVGLSLILIGQGFSLNELASQLNTGDLLTLFCALSFAAHILLVGHFVDADSYRTLLIIQIAAAAVLSLGGTLTFENLHFNFSPTVWNAIAITGLFATALAFWAQNKFQPLSTPTRTAIIFSTEPVFAGLFGFSLLGERLSMEQLLGAGLILLGIVLSQLPSQARRV
ncbi:DMT family transporter [Candidatus Acetothermia bacterium]|nr:DMT family transporter [Candidatus Acetothermia bacterium]MBI3459654.1 DMT family transporter [Candidatus Acetothermia bacterium]